MRHAGEMHLLPVFAADRLLASVSRMDLTAYAADRLKAGAAAATVNQELAIVKRAFRLAMRATKLLVMLFVPMLALHNARSCFFRVGRTGRDARALARPSGPPLRFAFITGWRLKSEVLPLTGDRVGVQERVVTLDPGTTKNGERRSFYAAVARPAER